MSQQTNAGFSGGCAPPLSVVADDPAMACPRIDTNPAEFPASLLPPFAGARLVGVGQSASASTQWSSLSVALDAPLLRVNAVSLDPFAALAVGVGHKPQAIPSVGRIDGTSRDNDTPAGVADAFQVSAHSVEPVLANRRRNLLSHEDSGPSGTGESKKVGPQVPIVSLRFALAGDRERLARRGAGPELAVVGPAGCSSGECPSADAGEKMTLPKWSQVSGLDIGD
nr:hypothetical protein [Lysobacter enzymogenes]